MIPRTISQKLLELSQKFPVIAVIGPRQSGKTTLVKHLFPEKDYLNLEEPDIRLFAAQDPRAFLANHSRGLIVDEAQQVPELFSYIQGMVDANPEPGHFVLTGSQHFLLHEKISQSLAGRVAILKLLPFSLEELKSVADKSLPFQEYIYRGFFPPIYDREIHPPDWFANYIPTYIERDVRSLKNITDLTTFATFLKLCAGRVGHLLNLTSLANELGVTTNTVRAWLSVLEASFVVFRVSPFYRNFNKRLVKMPKLYFYDTGLACYLLGIREVDQLNYHFLKGELFENLILSEVMKFYLNRGEEPLIYFWRDKSGREIDCLIDRGGTLKALEIKVSQTISGEFFKNLAYWQTLSGSSPEDSYLIYGGDQTQNRSIARVHPWHDLPEVLATF
ncbi:MAG: ATP-binding protein [Calditrichaeota bacterium]|nr:MAG: ATP-binding protein [Calditrichota bacterium]